MKGVPLELPRGWEAVGSPQGNPSPAQGSRTESGKERVKKEEISFFFSPFSADLSPLVILVTGAGKTRLLFEGSEREMEARAQEPRWPGPGGSSGSPHGVGEVGEGPGARFWGQVGAGKAAVP